MTSCHPLSWVRFVPILLSVAAGFSQPAELPSNLYWARITITDSAGRALSGVDVRLDGTVAGRTDESGVYYLLRKPIATGRHELTLTTTGFRDVSKPLVIPEDQEAAGVNLEITLERGGPAERVSSQGSGPLEFRVKPEPNRQVVRVYYATDRRDTGRPDPMLRYSSDRGDLSYGYCDVSMPKDHRMGVMESPSLLKLEFKPDPRYHVIALNAQPLVSDKFYTDLKARVDASASKEVLVFIHGFNTTFEQAARTTAQVAYDIGAGPEPFRGVPVLYSWPSQGRLFGYTQDEDAVIWTAVHLRQFLEEMAARSGAAHINLLAHSMGSRALTSALQVIAARPRPAGHSVFNQVILAAPDVGADTLQLVAKDIETSADRVTLYYSSNDDALLLSRYFHGAMRAGQGLLLATGIDTVDASKVRTDFMGHSYFANHDSILADLRILLTRGWPPPKRKLLEATLAQVRYWLIPDRP